MPGPSREKDVKEGTGKIQKRGEGLGTGPVGENSEAAKKASEGRPQQGTRPSGGQGGISGQSFSEGSSTSGKRPGVRAAGGLGVIAIIAALLFGGNLFGGGGGGTTNTTAYIPAQTTAAPTTQAPTQAPTQVPTTQAVTPTTQSAASNYTTYSGGSLSDLLSLFGGGGYASQAGQSAGQATSQASQTSWGANANTGKLDTTVASGSPAKRTTIKGGGKDVINIMVYMCGADLESQGGAATSDLQEMLNADVGDNINLIIYTGGAKSWQNKYISNKVNQIYQIRNHQLYCLADNAGNAAMTNPDTLAGFLKTVKANFPADRNMLVFWDHGAGSVSGYGYDEKYSSSGSMSLSGINKALKSSGIQFDMIGFDCCLMATVENALMLSNYGDYMVASEEVEPGIGWYYTDWLTNLNKNTSMSTLELGKNICDDFVKTCYKSYPRQGTTLSVVDLAELSYTVPDKLAAFASATADMIDPSVGGGSEYDTVAKARANTREFCPSQPIDQVDLVHLTYNINSQAGNALASALTGAIKYNLTSSAMTNAYGLAAYFPYKKVSYVDKAVSVNADIGVTSEYSDCIKKFASMGTAGHIGSGGGSALDSLFGSFGSTYSGSGASYSSQDMISSLLGSFLGGGYGRVAGLDETNTAFFSERLIDTEAMAQYVYEHHIDETKLMWTQAEDGSWGIELDEETAAQLTDIKYTLFYDDGEGYIDLGRDSYYKYDSNGRLLALTDHSWITFDEQIVCAYHEDTVENDGSVYMQYYVPVLYNGTAAQLILAYENNVPYIEGIRFAYSSDVTETIAKSIDLKDGDEIYFIADYYDYDGNYKDSFVISDLWTYDSSKSVDIADMRVGDDNVKAMYYLKDLYNQEYWTEVMP